MRLGCDESLPSGWKWIKAQDYIDVRDGTHDSPKPVEAGIPLVTSKNLVKGSIDFSTCTFISEDDHVAISKRSAVDDGDILYAMIGTIGNPVIVDKVHEFSIKNVALFKFKNEAVYNRYVFHFLNSGLAKKQFQNKSRGGTQKFVSLGNIRELEIPLPPLKEQKRIAAILDKADNLRRKRQEAIELADDFLRAVFLDMFGDPVTNPKGWDLRKLGDVVDTQLGKMLSQKAKEGPSPKKYLRNANVRWRDFKLDDLLSMDFNEKEMLKFELREGDLLVCEGGDVGRCAIWRDQVEHCYYQKALHRIRPYTDELRSEYVQEYFYWMSKRGGLSDSVSEVTFSHLTAEKMKELDIPVPPLSLQDEFVNLYSAFEKAKSRNLIVGGINEKCFSSISQKAFAGKL
jgi:type I restriction enzyme S subunit